MFSEASHSCMDSNQLYLGHGLVVVIEAISPLEVDAQGAVPMLGQGPAPLNGSHQPGHFHIALRASGLSWRATALILSLCMNQIACSKGPPVPSLAHRTQVDVILCWCTSEATMQVLSKPLSGHVIRAFFGLFCVTLEQCGCERH